MPAAGALWNPEAEVELTRLTTVVEAARARALPTGGSANLTQRPGWAPKLALEVLAEADEPLRGFEVKQAFEERLGEPANKETVRYALRFSRQARDGQIVRLEDGRYALGLRERDRRDGVSSSSPSPMSS